MGSAPLEAARAELERDRRFGDLGSPVDNVTRKLAYEQAHPDVRFVPPCVHDGCWTAVLEAGAVEVRAVNLELLLDELDARGG